MALNNFRKKSPNLEEKDFTKEKTSEKNKFDFTDDSLHRTEEIEVQGETLTVNITRHSNVDMVEMKLTSLQALIEFYEQKIKGFEEDLERAENVKKTLGSLNKTSRENEVKANSGKRVAEANLNIKTKELDKKTEEYQAFEERKGKGRPKLTISDELLEIAYKGMQKEINGVTRYSYTRAYKILQKHGYEGSDVHLAKCLREKYPNLPKKKVKVNPVGLAMQERFKTEIKQAEKSDQEAK